MTTRDRGLVDLVGLDEARAAAVLVMVEDRRWGDTGQLLPDLEAKLDTYLSFVLDGALVDSYPELAGKKVIFELRCAEPPGEREEEFIRIVREKHLEPAGIRLEWKALSNPS